VISATLANIKVKKILIREENLFNILYRSTFQKLGIPSFFLSTTLFKTFGFVNRIWTPNKKMCNLLTTFGTNSHFWTLLIKYILVEGNTPYEAIIDRTTLIDLRAIISMMHVFWWWKFGICSGLFRNWAQLCRGWL